MREIRITGAITLTVDQHTGDMYISDTVYGEKVTLSKSEVAALSQYFVNLELAENANLEPAPVSKTANLEPPENTNLELTKSPNLEPPLNFDSEPARKLGRILDPRSENETIAFRRALAIAVAPRLVTTPDIRVNPAGRIAEDTLAIVDAIVAELEGGG